MVSDYEERWAIACWGTFKDAMYWAMAAGSEEVLEDAAATTCKAILMAIMRHPEWGQGIAMNLRHDEHCEGALVTQLLAAMPIMGGEPA